MTQCIMGFAVALNPRQYNHEMWLQLLPLNVRPSREMSVIKVRVLRKHCCDSTEVVCLAERLLSDNGV